MKLSKKLSKVKQTFKEETTEHNYKDKNHTPFESTIMWAKVYDFRHTNRYIHK